MKVVEIVETEEVKRNHKEEKPSTNSSKQENAARGLR
jgi:hypothetical protein